MTATNKCMLKKDQINVSFFYALHHCNFLFSFVDTHLVNSIRLGLEVGCQGMRCHQKTSRIPVSKADDHETPTSFIVP
jgi:hypothetical protein